MMPGGMPEEYQEYAEYDVPEAAETVAEVQAPLAQPWVWDSGKILMVAGAVAVIALIAWFIYSFSNAKAAHEHAGDGNATA